VTTDFAVLENSNALKRRWSRRALLAALALWATVVASPTSASEPSAPTVSHHQHLISPRFADLVNEPVFEASDLVAQLDAAGIREGVVLSMGYTFGDDRKPIEEPDRLTREENDWTSEQVSRFADRLVGFCSVNPLREAAISEVTRCLALPGMVGVKLHFGNSGVDLLDPSHVQAVQAVFQAADERGAAIIVHMRARTTQTYGAPQAEVFLAQLMPAAPHVVVQIAHMAGAGPGYQEDVEQAFMVFAEAISAHDPRVENLIFDVSTVATENSTPADLEAIAASIRLIGPEYFVFGADHSIGGNPPPLGAWQAFGRVPLSEAERAVIAQNKAAYVHFGDEVRAAPNPLPHGMPLNDGMGVCKSAPRQMQTHLPRPKADL
jgi:predicted TIM-barrel fold metal-dependent hydrolase